MPIFFVEKMWEAFALQKLLSFLARLDEDQEEQLYYPQRWRQSRR